MKRKLQMPKKILSVLLCALVLFSCVPMSVISASAESASNITVAIDTGAEVTLKDTDADGYYEIGTADELYAFAYAVNGGSTSINAELTADIVVNEGTMTADSTDARPWTPIGYGFYSGVFNGGNHTVSGLYFNDSTANFVGLFYVVKENGIVKNTGVINSYFNGNQSICGVVGYNYGTITNCYTTDTVVKGNSNLSGITGVNEGTITNCHNTNVVLKGNYLGGIAGYNYGTITNCYNTNTVAGDSYLGGITGVNEGTITNCYNTTNTVAGYNYLGGIAGINYSTITNCYNKGIVNGTDYVGGVVGDNYGTITNCYNTGEISSSGIVGGIAGSNDEIITNCYNTGVIVNYFYEASGVVNYDFGTITNCYYLDTACAGGIEGGEVEGSAEEKTAEEFASGEVAYLLQGEQTEEVWGQDITTGDDDTTVDAYPVLGGDKVYQVLNYCKGENVYRNVDEAIGHNYDENGFCTVCDVYEPAILNTDNYYEIDNAGKLYWFADKVNSGETSINAKLTADIVVNEGTMTAETDSTKVRNWTPIGNESNKYTGKFYGSDYTISGLYFNNEEAMDVGLVGFLSTGGLVDSVGIKNSYFNGYDYIGAVAGYNHEGTITNSYNTGEVSSNRDDFAYAGSVGGITGVNEGTITNSYNTGFVSGGDISVGGVVGWNNGTITNSYNTGSVSGKDDVGGVVGYNDGSGTITNSYNTGSVSGYDSVGGVAGYNDDSGTITTSYNTGSVSGDDYVGGVAGWNNGTITNSYNTGSVSGYDDVGGVVGGNNGIIGTSYNTGSVSGRGYDVGGVVGSSRVTITNCYYLNTSYNGGIKGADVAGSAEAKTAEQFASGEVAYLLQGEQTEEVWGQDITTGNDDTTVDAYPVLSGDKVYGVKKCNGEIVKYGNVDETIGCSDYDENGFCTVCNNGYEPAILNSDNYYEIDNAGKLYWFADKVNSGETSINAKLTANIVVNEGTMTAETDSTTVRHWTPIGNYDRMYTGNFYGADYTISGLYFNNEEAYYVGLVGCLGTGALVDYVGIENSYFNGCYYVGAVVGRNYGTLTNSYNTGTVSGNGNVGGVAGNNYGTLTNSYNTGTVSGDNCVGGVAGANVGTLTNSYNTGTVSGSVWVGGVVGDNAVTLTNSYNTGTVSGNGNVGGVAGLNSGTLTNSYNTGIVSGSAWVGGVVGLNDGSTITNSYYLNTSYNGGIDGADVAGSAEAKTAKQFASGEVAYLLQAGVTAENGEEIPEIWGQKIGTDEFPVLKGDKVYVIKTCSGEFVKYSNSNEIIHSFNNTHVCKTCYALEENQIAGVAGYNISLGGNIAVNYYMVLDESVATNANTKVVFTVPSGDEVETVEYSVNDATKNGDFYVFTCEVSAKEMASNIICKVVSGDSVSSTFTYSVKQYADTILANPDKYEKELSLVKAMLNYGAYAQEYFNHNTDNLANASLDKADKAIADELDLSAYASKLSGTQEGVSFYGSVLSLKSETAIKLYFKFENEDDVNTLPITVNGRAVTATKNGKYYEIKISNIPAHKLSDMFEVKIGDLALYYGAFSYGHTAMNTDKEALKNAIKAMYAYNQVAVEYKK